MSRYYTFNRYLRDKYNCRVRKISVDAGFDCPNQDGTLSRHGCIFCNNEAFSANKRERGSIELFSQVKNGIEHGKKKCGAEKFIVYFQSYTNTYAAKDILKKRYDVVKEFDDIVGIAIGTRPDCVQEDILRFIDTYADKYEVWIEYGLQSVHDRSLQMINRNHTYDDFLKAVSLTRKVSRAKICAHIILGLPLEGELEMLEIARQISFLKLEGIKIHPLHVVKGTKLEQIPRDIYPEMRVENYVDIVCKFLELIPEDTVIQRITADCPEDMLIAPKWILDKKGVLSLIEAELEKRDIWQGKKCSLLRP